MTDEAIDWPTNVRVEMANGESIPCELVYLGRDNKGVAQFEATAAVPSFRTFNVLMDRLPARTSISFRVAGPRRG